MFVLKNIITMVVVVLVYVSGVLGISYDVAPDVNNGIEPAYAEGELLVCFARKLDEVRFPIHALWPILDKVTWLVDSEAAANLSPRCVAD